MSRSQKLIQNTLWSLVARSWPMALHFFTTPFLVFHMGVDAYGVYAMIFLMLGYFGFLDLGLSKALVKFLSKAKARERNDEARSLVATAILFYVVLGLVGSAVLLGLSRWIVDDVLTIPAALRDDALNAFRICAVLLLINMATQAWTAVPRAFQRFDLSGKLAMLMVTMQSISAVVILSMGGGLGHVVMGIGVTSLIGLVLTIAIAMRLLPLCPWPAGLRLAQLWQLLRFGAYVTANGLLIQLSVRINGLIIGIFHPVAAFAYYSVADSLATRVSTIAASINDTVFPSFSELQELGREDLLRSLFVRSTRYIVVLTIPFFFLFLAFADTLFSLWLDDSFAEQGANILRVLGSAYLVSYWGYSAVAASNGLNRPDLPTRWQGALAAINVVLCLMLVGPFGIMGAALAWSVHRFVLVPCFIASVGKTLFDIRARDLWREAFQAPLLVGCVFLFVSFALRPLVDSLLALMVTLALLSLAYLAACYLIVLDDTDRREAERFITGYLEQRPA